MTLAPGTRLGPYAITGKLGEGGMGEVWRATDSRLKREVAIKVLPAAFTADPERLARFEREAQLLAQLHHPNIASIFGLEEADGARALVMELVEGPTLAERLERGALPVGEAVAIALQIALALEEAHEKGIVHRDLKPQNVKASPEGTVKVLDFGLARAGERETSSPSAAALARSPAFLDSPTLTAAHTVQGVILGTAAYMSPEQARGRRVDRRADIWAFGCVLYEMLTGVRAFGGDTVSDTMAAVLTRDPDWSALPAATPARLRALLARCLRKDARERLRDIGDARLELAEIGGAAAAGGDAPAAGPAPAAPPRRRRVLAFGGVAALALVALGVGLWLGARSAVAEPPAFRPLTFDRGYVHSARFAPDGQTVIYGGAFEGRPVALYTTRIDSSESRPIELPSADVAGIARDGQMALLLGRHHVGSWLRVGTLAQVGLSGGAPRQLLENVYDADISPDGKQFAVVVADGDAQVLQYPIGKEIYRSPGWIALPRIAPDGRRIAFVDHRVFGDDLGTVELAGVDGKVVATSGEAQYLQGLAWSPDGSALWFTGDTAQRAGALWRVVPGGAPRVVLNAPTALRLQDISAAGQLLLVTEEPRAVLAGQLAGDASERSYSWWDADLVEGISSDGTTYVGVNPSVLVDDEYSVFVRQGGAPPVLLGNGIAGGITPDGRSVFVTLLHGKRSEITIRPVGPGQPRVLALGDVSVSSSRTQTFTFSADGKRFAFVGARPGTGRTAWVMDVEGGAARAVSPAGATGAVLSPDGTRVAVADPARGPYVIRVAGGEPLPLPGAPRQDSPVAWSADGAAVLSWDHTLPPRIYRTTVADGRRELQREIVASDPAGLLYGLLRTSPDGRFYLLRSRRVLSTVQLVTLPQPHGPLSWLTGAAR